MKVYIVTDVEAGWDCIKGVFSDKRLAIISELQHCYMIEPLDNKTDQELLKLWHKYCDNQYIIHERNII